MACCRQNVYLQFKAGVAVDEVIAIDLDYARKPGQTTPNKSALYNHVRTNAPVRSSPRSQIRAEAG